MMPRYYDGETFYTASEAARYIGVARRTFLTRYRPKLKPWRFQGLVWSYYREEDLKKCREPRPDSEEK